MCIAFRMGIGLVVHVVVRHGNVTSVRDVVLMILFVLIDCYSNLLRLP